MQIQPISASPATGRSRKYSPTAAPSASREQTSCRPVSPKKIASRYSRISFGIFTSIDFSSFCSDIMKRLHEIGCIYPILKV